MLVDKLKKILFFQKTSEHEVLSRTNGGEGVEEVITLKFIVNYSKINNVYKFTFT